MMLLQCRVFMPGLVVCAAQIDMCSLEEVDELAHMPNSVPISCGQPPLNLDGLLELIWDMMALVGAVLNGQCTCLVRKYGLEKQQRISFAAKPLQEHGVYVCLITLQENRSCSLVSAARTPCSCLTARCFWAKLEFQAACQEQMS